MEISAHIVEEARRLLLSSEPLVLPMQLQSAPGFYLAAADDRTVIAFTAVSHAGAAYKIGPGTG